MVIIGDTVVAATAPDIDISSILKQQRGLVSIVSYRSGFVMATILRMVTQQRICIEMKNFILDLYV